eukprot:1158187-Pelagomonas_calceolata.AAC.8
MGAARACRACCTGLLSQAVPHPLRPHPPTHAAAAPAPAAAPAADSAVAAVRRAAQRRLHQ